MHLNINRIFKLNIRNKLVVAFLCLSSVPLLLSGLYAIHLHTQTLQKDEIERLEHGLLTIREQTHVFLSGVESDLHYLRTSRPFRKLLQNPEPQENIVAFSQQLLDFAQNKPIYYQIRFLDASGQEIIKISASNDGYRIIKPDPDAASQYYMYLVDGLKQERVISAPVELTDNQGGLVAAFCYALPIFNDAFDLQGLLITDIFARDLFAVLTNVATDIDGQLVLVSQEGYYLYHSQKKKTWSQLMAARDEHNLYRDYPEEITRKIMSNQTGVLNTDNRVIVYAPLFRNTASNMGAYALFLDAPQEQILKPVIRFKLFFYILLGISLFLSTGLGYLASAQFTQPIKALQAEAKVVAGGAFGRRLRVQTYDEIQDLAETFNAMARAIQERENKIQQHRIELENMVSERTRELVEEKGKLQTILDTVPSAFVVLDTDLTILSASRAFEHISGYPPDAVIGQRYARFFPGSEPSADSPAAVALRTGHIVTSTKVIKASTKPTYTEHIAIPISRNGVSDRVIEVVTDVTERKEMEAQVIHSEKLATTGEMAAVIAHEMRNSLTSVKMILQLELERENLAAEDREALNVAATSVRRMETIVTDLLKFARPSPPQFRASEIHAILSESIALIQHQIYRKSIAINKNFTVDPLPVQGDVDQLKEVFVNILLNAVQAVPSGGEIILSTYKTSDTIEIKIRDTGPGIAPDHLERLFDPFVTTKPEGTGLGLSMARRIIEAHNGKITSENVPDGGALFTVQLPENNKPSTESSVSWSSSVQTDLNLIQEA